MITKTVKLLNLSLQQNGRLSGTVERYFATEHIRLAWNETKAPTGFEELCGGVAFICGHDKTEDEPKPFTPDHLGSNRYACRDTAFVELMIVIVVLPKDHVLLSPQDAVPPAKCFKVFDERMAFYWEVMSPMSEVIWKMSKRSNRNLEKLVFNLNGVAYTGGLSQKTMANHDTGGTKTTHDNPQPPQSAHQPAVWEKVTVAVLAVIVIASVLYAALQKDEIPARNFALIRILLSAAMGVMGGVIPGFLKVNFSFTGAAVRAGGGLALAAITFFFTPHIVPNDPAKPTEAITERRRSNDAEQHLPHASSSVSVPVEETSKEQPIPTVALSQSEPDFGRLTLLLRQLIELEANQSRLYQQLYKDCKSGRETPNDDLESQARVCLHHVSRIREELKKDDYSKFVLGGYRTYRQLILDLESRTELFEYLSHRGSGKEFFDEHPYDPCEIAPRFAELHLRLATIQESYHKRLVGDYATRGIKIDLD